MEKRNSIPCDVSSVYLVFLMFVAHGSPSTFFYIFVSIILERANAKSFPPSRLSQQPLNYRHPTSPSAFDSVSDPVFDPAFLKSP
jgi:hypothetical protein